MTRIGVVGASGRTGSCAVRAVLQRSDCSLIAAIVSSGSPVLSHVVPETSVSYSSSLGDLAGCDAVIDFSTPEVSVLVAEGCAKMNIPLLVATTGHSSAQLETIRSYGARIPLGITSNTSVGAAALSKLASKAKLMLGEDFDIEVMEIHHRMKKDAPSGTARSVLEDVRGDSRVVFGREGQRQSEEIGVVSLRGGDVVGDHTVYFLGQGERIEITHRVATREVFGVGAVRFALKLIGKTPGVYGAKDLV
jgi:4-hydroxy-tetrahydrodipicolinate reductase